MKRGWRVPRRCIPKSLPSRQCITTREMFGLLLLLPMIITNTIWASFEIQSRISGTPGQIGSHSNIEVSLSCRGINLGMWVVIIGAYMICIIGIKIVGKSQFLGGQNSHDLLGATWGGSDYSQNWCHARKSRASRLNRIFARREIGKICENTEHSLKLFSNYLRLDSCINSHGFGNTHG